MLEFSITDFKLSHGFSSKNGLINGRIGSFFFLCGLCCYVWYHGLFISCLGGVSVGLSFSCDKYLYCFVFFCFGRGIGITCS